MMDEIDAIVIAHGINITQSRQYLSHGQH